MLEGILLSIIIAVIFGYMLVKMAHAFINGETGRETREIRQRIARRQDAPAKQEKQ